MINEKKRLDSFIELILSSIEYSENVAMNELQPGTWYIGTKKEIFNINKTIIRCQIITNNT